MHKLALILISALSLISSSALAASYQQITGGTIIDPIQCYSGCVGDHPYSGINLEPFADLSGANLSGADLAGAILSNTDLSGADLSGAQLLVANLDFATLVGADLSGAQLLVARADSADLSGANLTSVHLDASVLAGADVSGADLSGASLLNVYLDGANLSGAILANATNLPSTAGSALYDINTDFTGTGFDPVAAGWTLVPEPSTALLMGLGLAGLASRRR